MARALVIEDESGICSGFMHPHNGYYAGDFHRADVQPLPTPRSAAFSEQARTAATVLQMARSNIHARSHAA